MINSKSHHFQLINSDSINLNYYHWAFFQCIVWMHLNPSCSISNGGLDTVSHLLCVIPMSPACLFLFQSVSRALLEWFITSIAQILYNVSPCRCCEVHTECVYQHFSLLPHPVKTRDISRHSHKEFYSDLPTSDFF